MEEKTSQRPCSSSLIVTYRLPHPVFTLVVAPVVTSGRGRGLTWPGAITASASAL